MSSLKDRLKRLTGSGSGPSAASLTAESADDGKAGAGEEVVSSNATEGDCPGGFVAGSPAAYTVELLEEAWGKLDAALIRNACGSFIRRRRVYPMNHRHGECDLSELHGAAGELAAFHGGEQPVRARELLFFDTETTGLGLGAGNVPFMIGLGFWEEMGFAVEQLFIRNPAEELAMLEYLKPILERYPYLVSYNGRSFDWPLLKNRFVMNRMKDGIADPLHLDFLYPSRSLWKNTLPSCRLSKVEEARLGFLRQDDVPGSMAPALYFLYLAEKRPADIGPVFVHNELDIVSLAGLAVLFGHTLAGRIPTDGCTPEEIYRLGLWLHKMGKTELSLKVLKPLHTVAARVETEGWFLSLAGHYKQLGLWDEAVELWQRAVETVRCEEAGGSPVEPCVELSMYYEHRQKDYATALLYAEEAFRWEESRLAKLQAVQMRELRLNGRKPKRRWEGMQRDGYQTDGTMTDGTGALSGTAAELQKRIARLYRKLARTGREASLLSDKSGGSGRTATGSPSRRSKKKPDAASGPEPLTLF